MSNQALNSPFAIANMDETDAMSQMGNIPLRCKQVNCGDSHRQLWRVFLIQPNLVIRADMVVRHGVMT